jgi:N-acetylglucosamine-6-phosphate deacetylase
LTLENVFCEIICDGFHIHPVAAQLVMKAAGYDRTVLITDCMMAGAMPDGDYFLGEFPVIKKDGAVRMVSGSLAGSALELKLAVKNVVDWGIASAREAIQMATEIPAKSAGIADRCGKIAFGRAADFIVLDPELRLKGTYVDGVLKYENR